jgi:ubiquitin carboxyl-terminal hydrolase 14
MQLLTHWRQGLQAGGSDIIRDLFQVKLEVQLQCTETEESISETIQSFNLKCNITADINHMHEGIHLGLVEDREKHSESLGRTAAWRGEARLADLPAYLTVQVMRFYYKVQQQQRAKIRRKVRSARQLRMPGQCECSS